MASFLKFLIIIYQIMVAPNVDMKILGTKGEELLQKNLSKRLNKFMERDMIIVNLNIRIDELKLK